MTLVFTDVEGSTALLRRAGPRYAELLAAHNDIVRTAMEARGGVVVRTEGDSLFCAFRDPVDAVLACLDAQRGLTAHPWPPEAVFRVRMGMHTGAVQLGGDDYVGLAVHQAARVADTPHGGQTVLSESTRQLVGDGTPGGVSFERLGAYRLKDFTDATVLYQLRHPDLPTEFPALRARPAAAHNLPEPATLFVGRQTALRELAGLVTATRLVTVTGAGGVGKTRLASELAPLVVGDFPEGVWMVELAKLRDGSAVAAEVAATLSVRIEGDAGAPQLLADALQGRRLLLLLDNCEHVLDELAPLVDGLLGACPDLHVLATSREPLALGGERRFPLAPLSLPPGDGAGLEELEGSEAVALFLDRARVVAPDFSLARDRDAVVEICRRLDGLPLAIELAAARAASVPPRRMATRLDRRFSVLRRSYRGRLPHHATLRASIEWSYDLLEDDERVLLARLAVFAGEFELEAAEAVCGQPPLDPDDILDLLGRLVEKSLVQPSGDRYVLLESIREFAREEAERAGEPDTLIDAHMAYYTELVERAVEEVEGPQGREVLDQLDAELPNIRAAVARALERSDPAALRLSSRLGQYGFIRNRLAEVAQWCIDAAAIPDAPPSLRAQALIQAGFALVMGGAPDGGLAVADDGVEQARRSGDQTLLATSLMWAADLRLEVGRDAQARPLASEAVALIRDQGDGPLLARALLLSARADHRELGPRVCAERLDPALSVFERDGERRLLARVLLIRAWLWLEAGERARADDDATACLTVARELEHAIGQGMARTVSVCVAIDEGRLSEAWSLLEENWAIARDCGYRTLLVYCLAAEAELCARSGVIERAARLLGALEGGAQALGGEGAWAIAQRLDALRHQLSAGFDGAAWEALRQEGQAAGIEALAAAAGAPGG